MPDTIRRVPTWSEAGRLRDKFIVSGYEDSTVRERLRIGSIVGIEFLHTAFYLHQCLADTNPQSALIRLFLLQCAVPESELCPTFGASGIALMAELGLVKRENGQLLPKVDLYPFGGDWLATDRSDQAAEGSACGRLDAVMPLNRSSHLLAQLVLPMPAEAVLDIGTGCGVHAIRAARRARRVVATDVNPRALQFAAFNAALNGVENVEFRLGSLWEPVAGETFDQILANPAFTLSASTDYLFRDGGPRGDRMTAALLSGAATHLREGGVMQVIGEFPMVGESGFEERVEEWVAEAPCDRLLLRFGAMEPLEYAAAYAHQPFGQSQEEYEAALATRLRSLAAIGAQEVVLGAVLLRRRAADSHWAARRVLPAPERPVDQELSALLARLDRWSDSEAPQRLWDGFPRMEAGLRLTEVRAWGPRGWEPETARAGVEGDPFRGELQLSGPARDLLTLCDGTRSGGEIAAQFARAYDLGADEADEATLAFLQELAEQGMIGMEEG